MTGGEDKIKNLFSSKLSNFEAKAPDSVWSELSALLPAIPIAMVASEVASSVGKTAVHTAAKSAVSKIGVGLLALTASMTGVYYLTKKEILSEPIPPTEAVVAVVEPQAEETVFVMDPIVSRPKKMPETILELAVEAKVEEKIPEVQILEEEKPVELEVLKKEKAPDPQLFEEPLLPIPKKKRTTINAIAGLSPNTYDLADRNAGLLFSRNNRPSELVRYLEQTNDEFTLSHKQPISIGLTVSRALTDRWSLETGLIFTYLKSDIKSKDSFLINEEQVFTYLGMPLFANFKFLEFGKSDFYITFGAMAQKDIFGRFTSEFTASQIESTGVEKGKPSVLLFEKATIKDYSRLQRNINQANWQLSSHLSLGVSYPIWKDLKVYGKFGAAYYFDAKNKYRTIYSDRDLQIDLNLGLKFDF